jgi:hypothetical protein
MLSNYRLSKLLSTILFFALFWIFNSWVSVVSPSYLVLAVINGEAEGQAIVRESFISNLPVGRRRDVYYYKLSFVSEPDEFIEVRCAGRKYKIGEKIDVTYPFRASSKIIPKDCRYKSDLFNYGFLYILLALWTILSIVYRLADYREDIIKKRAGGFIGDRGA